MLFGALALRTQYKEIKDHEKKSEHQGQLPHRWLLSSCLGHCWRNEKVEQVHEAVIVRELRLAIQENPEPAAKSA